MKKNTEIDFDKNKITVLFNNVIKNQEISLEFKPLNRYQLICNKITINNKSKSIHINSTDLRKINIHSLVKTSLKLIDKNIYLDQKKYNKLDPIYNPSLKVNDLAKLINKNKYTNRDELLSIYSLLYINIERDFGDNISKTIHPKILRAKEDNVEIKDFNNKLIDLEKYVSENDLSKAKKLIFDLV